MAEPLLKIDLSEDGIATLTMSRPGKRNAMSDKLLAEIAAGIGAVLAFAAGVA